VVGLRNPAEVRMSSPYTEEVAPLSPEQAVSEWMPHIRPELSFSSLVGRHQWWRCCWLMLSREGK
jgi:hypothetical protein